MSVIDAEVFFRARSARRDKTAPQPTATYEALLLRDLSIGELVHALRGSGLVASTIHGQTVLHRPHKET